MNGLATLAGQGEAYCRIKVFVSISHIGSAIMKVDGFFRNSVTSRDVASRAFLVLALSVWCAAQVAFIAKPLWTRVLPMELDDSLPYLVRVQQLEECPLQNCPALDDLRQQLFTPSPDAEAARERGYAASAFPHYHPLFSVVLLALKKAGLDPVTAYKVLWTSGPVLFGVGFAYLLTALFGRYAAGIALILLMAKIFPSSGLHQVVPSNLSMGVAMLLWGRIVARKGDCPWSMPLGSVAIVALHPVGLAYVGLGAGLALAFGGWHRTSRAWKPILLTALFFIATLLVLFAAGVPHLAVPVHLIPTGGEPFLDLFRRGVQSFTREVVPNVLRLEGGLFGSIPWFCGWVALGLVSLAAEVRGPLLKFLGLYFVVLVVSLFHIQFNPADLFLRLWIPWIFILFGAVASGVCYLLRESKAFLLRSREESGPAATIAVGQAWPVIMLAVFFGYAFLMNIRGAEQIIATARYLKDRQPYAFFEEQPRKLLAEAKPGDRVLYTSYMIMPYYFIYGAMQLGAVYYHPTLERTRETMEWLRRPDVRFAVSYNPTVYRPKGDGLRERECLLTPQFYFSPLSDPPVYSPLSKDGALHSEDYQWLDLRPTNGPFPGKLRVLVRNDGPSVTLAAGPIDQGAEPAGPMVKQVIPEKWDGWIEYPVATETAAKAIRIVMPRGRSLLAISGIAFDDEKHFWPWTAKTTLTVMSTNPLIGEVTVSFDPAKCLPPQFKDRKISVLNDKGSSVLFRIE